MLRNRLEQLMQNEKEEDQQLAQFRLFIISCYSYIIHHLIILFCRIRNTEQAQKQKVRLINPAVNLSFPLIAPETAGFELEMHTMQNV